MKFWPLSGIVLLALAAEPAMAHDPSQAAQARSEAISADSPPSAATPARRPARSASQRASRTAPEEELPLPPPPPPAPAPAPIIRGELAPMPNRNIEAPRDRSALPPGPVFEPTLIAPQERRQGFTFGREHLREDGPDRPLSDLAPGARLRIPLN